MAGSYNDQKVNLAKSQQALVVVLDKSPGPDFSTRRPIQFDRNTKPATSSGLQANLLGTYEFASAIKLNLLFGADYDKNELDELNRKSTADNTIAFFLSNPDTWNYVYPAESTFTRTTVLLYGPRQALGRPAQPHVRPPKNGCGSHHDQSPDAGLERFKRKKWAHDISGRRCVKNR